VPSVVVNVLAAVEHPWRLDLVALAGILTGAGTLALAFYTFRLAKSTRRLASETGDDVRAGWRPVLLMSDSQVNLTRQRAAPKVSAAGGVLNGGRGPALNTTGSITSPTDTQETIWTPGDIGAGQTSRFDLDDALVIDVPDDPGASKVEVEVTLTYEDLGGRRYETKMHFVDLRAGPTRSGGADEWIVDLDKTEVRDLGGSRPAVHPTVDRE
jgi:hypothetical protein